MNEMIKEIEFKTPSTIKVNLLKNGDGVEFLLNEDIIKLEAKHNQDCCERVYADFGILSYYLNDNNYLRSPYVDFIKLIIKKVEKVGILLIFKRDEDYYQKILIPCYNEQNGYYSDNLILKITHNGKTEEIDITECNQDLIFP